MVTVTPLPPGVRPPFFNVNPTAPMPRAQPTRSGAVVVQPGARIGLPRLAKSQCNVYLLVLVNNSEFLVSWTRGF